jgi:protein-tyrosine phosphatase family protein
VTIVSMPANHASAPANARDLGGLRCEDGGIVRRGIVWRSAAHGLATPAVVRSLPGRVHFFDLRSHREVGEVGTVSICRHHWPMSDLPGWNLRPVDRDADYYVDSAIRLIPRLGDVLTDLLSVIVGGFGPVVVGCRLGKDRTGLLVLALGALCGIRRADLIDDYLVTSTNIRAARPWVESYAAARQEDPDDVMRRFTPHRDIPSRILTELSGGDTLAGQLRIPAGLLAGARTRLVVAGVNS